MFTRILGLMLMSGLLQPASARTLLVGAGHALRVPSQAATIAFDGDRIEIEPGTYEDCASFRQSRLTIQAMGPGVVIDREVCESTALFVIWGNDITIRGLTFANAVTTYGNAAGIKMHGANLTVEDSRFIDNQNGILAGGPPASVVRVLNSEFRGNGSCIAACAHAIYAGAPIALLDVVGSRFLDTRTAHHIKSRARSTIVVGNRIEDGDRGTASYMIETPNGGNLLVQDNILRKGRLSENPVAISIGVEGVTNRTEVLIVKDNRFTSDLSEIATFVRNSTTAPARLSGNRLFGAVVALDGPGQVTPAAAAGTPNQ